MNTSVHVAQNPYTSVDAINRHDFGIQKNRKPASTGGGRAWSEDEVGYHVWFAKNKLMASIGSLPSANSSTKDALQTHCCSFEKD